jgi:predicted DsbA family dithiol-disulfide isomerase
MSGMALPLTIDVVSDVVCPWCFVGKRRLEKALAAMGGRYGPRVTWLPFQLNPAMPKEGIDRDLYRDLRFGSLDESEDVDRRLVSAGDSEGIPFAFDRISRVPNTFDAHRLIWLARREGRQDPVVEALFRRYFLEGEDVGDRGVLRDVAGSCGIDGETAERFLEGGGGTEEVRAEETLARERGVNAVPCFVINNRFTVVGAREAGALASAFEEAARRSGGEAA